ncbi:MAG TPA: vWA domain-containing protein [Candidatus Binataceae bacterium]|nr:vWA domain-containing protein [Candidatus Binataceae bacterium]
MLTAVVVILIAISIGVVAYILNRLMSGRRACARPSGGGLLEEDATRIDEEGHSVRDALRFMVGPFPLSIALHVILLLVLVATVKVQNARNLIMVSLQAGGGGGANHDELRDLDMPDLSVPDELPQLVAPSIAQSSRTAVQTAKQYVRDVSTGGVGIGRGGGMGAGYGPGIGAGFGGFIGELRRKGLDIVLVIDDTGTMDLILNDVRDRMDELIAAIHRLVPVARIGIVVFGGHNERMDIQPLTISSHRLEAFLESISTRGHRGSQGDVYGACVTAVNQMNWKPYAKKVIVLVGDSPPQNQDFGPLLGLIRKFRAEDGTFNTIDVSAEEHERYEREFWLKTHKGRPPGESISPLAEFYQDTRETYKMLAAAGGGGMRSLTQNVHINEQVLILALGAQWQGNLAAFGRQITEAEQ